MMEFEDFGIRSRKHSTPDEGQSILSLKRLLMKCRRILSLMENFGTSFNRPSRSSVPQPVNHSIDRFGRDTFQEAMKLSQRTNLTELNWKQFKYVVFDIPNREGSYAERHQALGEFPSSFLPPPPPQNILMTNI